MQGVGCDMLRHNRITQEHRQRIVQAFENEVVFVFILEDIIPKALDSVGELEELSSRLHDDDYRKKLVG